MFWNERKPGFHLYLFLPSWKVYRKAYRSLEKKILLWHFCWLRLHVYCRKKEKNYCSKVTSLAYQEKNVIYLTIVKVSMKKTLVYHASFQTKSKLKKTRNKQKQSKNEIKKKEREFILLISLSVSSASSSTSSSLISLRSDLNKNIRRRRRKMEIYHQNRKRRKREERERDFYLRGSKDVVLLSLFADLYKTFTR